MGTGVKKQSRLSEIIVHHRISNKITQKINQKITQKIT